MAGSNGIGLGLLYSQVAMPFYLSLCNVHNEAEPKSVDCPVYICRTIINRRHTPEGSTYNKRPIGIAEIN